MFIDQIETGSLSKDGCNLHKREKEEEGGGGGGRETALCKGIFVYTCIVYVGHSPEMYFY